MEQNYAHDILNNENQPEFQEDANQNNNEYIANQEQIDNEQVEEAEGDVEDDDDRLTYTLITLDLGNLIHIFEDNNISFVDMLLLTKEDLIELQLEIFQRNRILNFSKLFTKYAKNYSIREISDFFTFNKQFIFNSSIYDKVYSSNMNDFQNENENNNNMNNFDTINPETNYLNTEPNNKNNMNNNMHNNNNSNGNYLSQTLVNKGNVNNFKTNKPLIVPKIKSPQMKPQNINGGINDKRTKNIMQKNIKNNINTNKNNEMNQNQEEIQNKLVDVIKKKKVPKSNINNKGFNLNNNNNKGNVKNNEINKNEEFQKIIEKIGILESTEMNYDLYTKLNLIKNYINMKGDKMSSDDLININNDIESMLNNSINLNYISNKGDNNKIRNKLKVIKK